MKCQHEIWKEYFYRPCDKDAEFIYQAVAGHAVYLCGKCAKRFADILNLKKIENPPKTHSQA